VTTSPKTLLEIFKVEPFKTIDSINLNFHGFQFNILRDDLKLRKALFQIFFIIPLACWLLLGSDSTIDQAAYLIFVGIPNFLLGHYSFNQLLATYSNHYGLGTHWSASVIYTLLFIGISKHLREELDLKNSENLAFTTCFVGLTIATFEFFWMISYYHFQNQTWILSLRFPQLRIILQNVMFSLPAIIIFPFWKWKTHHFNINTKTLFYVSTTIILILIWFNYGLIFPVEQLKVDVEGFGTWISSKRFPQTMYTIDMNVSDNIAVGEMFYVQNNAIHFVNNTAKIMLSLAFYNLFKIRELKKNE